MSGPWDSPRLGRYRRSTFESIAQTCWKSCSSPSSSNIISFLPVLLQAQIHYGASAGCRWRISTGHHWRTSISPPDPFGRSLHHVSPGSLVPKRKTSVQVIQGVTTTLLAFQSAILGLELLLDLGLGGIGEALLQPAVSASQIHTNRPTELPKNGHWFMTTQTQP